MAAKYEAQMAENRVTALTTTRSRIAQAAQALRAYGHPSLRGIAGFTGAVLLLLTSCTSPCEVYVTDVSTRQWYTPAVVTIPNTDTTSLRDLSVFVRSNDRFTADTLTLRITVYTPDSLRHEERLLITLPPSNRSAALAQETRIPYRTRVQLQRRGDYRVLLTPTVAATGIEAAGIHIEKSN